MACRYCTQKNEEVAFLAASAWTATNLMSSAFESGARVLLDHRPLGQPASDPLGRRDCPESAARSSRRWCCLLYFWLRRASVIESTNILVLSCFVVPS